jgi:cell division protein FtsL
MRLCVRLAILAAMLIGLAMGLIYLRTDTSQAGHRLHNLFSQKRAIEKTCCRLEISVAGLKNQERLRQQATELLMADDGGDQPAAGPHPGAGLRPPALLVNRNKPPSP